MVIDEFRGPYRWLSNFEYCSVEYEGLVYPSSEHAYQAAKSIHPEVRELVRRAATCREAKRLGNALELREDWEQVKLLVMRDVLRDKFTRNPHLKQKLLATGKAELIEGNSWGDTFWGVCRGQGQNHLGQLLMRLRDELGE